MKFAAALAGLAISVSSAALADGLPDLGGKEIVIVTENAYPPLQFMADGKAIGWEYDAIAELSKRMNFTVKYETTSWDAMIPAVSEGQFDMGMTGITITDERKEKVDFSEPYMRSESVMMVRGDEARFTDAASFAANPQLKLVLVAATGTNNVDLAAAQAHGVTVRTTFLGAHVVPPEFAERRADYIDQICEVMMPTLAAEGLIDQHVHGLRDAHHCGERHSPCRVVEASGRADGDDAEDDG